MVRSAHGRAGGKVILLGEHAVVYGRPALAVGIAPGVSAHVADGEGPRLVSAVDDDGRGTTLVAEAARLVGLPPARVVVSVTSDLPPGRGLGSSAALAVATLRALAAAAERRLTPEEECRFGRELEAIFHGTPSGVDPAAAALGGCLRFVRGEPPAVREVVPGGRLDLVVAYGREPRRTGAAVGGLRERWLADRVRHERLFDEVADVVAAGISAVEHGDATALGAAFDANQRLLEMLGVSSPAIAALTAAARAAGACGAKLTGGGAGGAIVAVAADGDAVAARLAHEGAAVLRARVSDTRDEEWMG
jgi:mevalonate kinase